MTNSSAAGPSAWARDLHVHLTSHVETERGLLEEYRSAAEASSSKAFAYLVNLLIEDEMRHQVSESYEAWPCWQIRDGNGRYRIQEP
jgi:hypothetical protein